MTQVKTKTRSRRAEGGRKFRYAIPEREETKRFYFDYGEADRAVRFIEENLVHSEDPHAGKPFILAKWQRTIIEDIFGWRRVKDDTRRYRTLYIEIPRKNGKSTLGAAIALYLMFADNEKGAQIVSAAADREQAHIIFGVASRMIEQSKKLRELAAVFRNSIAYYKLGNSYKVLSADVRAKHGKNLHGILFDELHEQPNRHLVDTLKTSTGTRVQPLQVYMTTAGFDRTSICWEYHQYAKALIEGRASDDSFYPVIFSAEEKDDWTDPKVWAKCNPNLGTTIRLEYLEEECAKAKKIPAYENTFRRLHLNQWTEQDVRMIPMHIWAKNAVEINPEDFRDQECWAGMDLGSTDDITSVVLVFQKGDDLKVIPYFYCPEEQMAERFARNPTANYPEWARRGYIIATEGNVCDYKKIRNDILDLREKYKIRKIAFDSWNATQITVDLAQDGFDMEPFRQGTFSMNAPTKEMLKRLAAGRLHHGNHPVMTWMAGNAAALTDGDGNIKPSKKKSKEKIDGIVALCMAIGVMIKEQNEGPSVYEERGLVVL